QAALARIGGRLEEQHVSADRGERQPGGDTGIGRALAYLALEAPWPEPAAHATLVDAQPLRTRLAFGDLTGRLAQHVGEPPLEVAHAGFACVLADDQPQRPVGDRDTLGAEAVRLELFRHQVALGDPELLLIRVPRELD